MTLGTVITLLVVGVAVFFALRSIVRDMRSGTSKCAECGGSCGKANCSTCDIADQMVQKLDAL